MISQQRDKVRDVALDMLPHISPDELQDPQDHPEVADDAHVQLRRRAAGRSHERPDGPAQHRVRRPHASSPMRKR